MNARRLQLVQLVAVADAGLVRVAWSAAWSCYLVTVTRPRLGVVAEHVAADRARTGHAIRPAAVGGDRASATLHDRNAGRTSRAKSRAGSRVSRPKNSMMNEVQPSFTWRSMRSITPCGDPQMPCSSSASPMWPP